MINVKIDPSQERTVLDFRPLGFRDVIVLGRYHYNRVHRPLETHSHGDMMEICLLERGRQSYVVEGREYVLRGGEVLFTLPRESHGTGAHPEDRGTLYWLILRVPHQRQRFLTLPPDQQRRLFDALLHLPSRVFDSRGLLKPHLDRIMEIHADATNPLRVVSLENYWLRFLLDFIELGKRATPPRASAPIQRVQRFIDANLARPLGVEELAQIASLSVSRFKARFRQEAGVPPADYVLRMRIEAAREQLARTTKTITEIGFDLGFSSSQHFATVFGKCAGVSPKVFRERFRHSARR